MPAKRCSSPAHRAASALRSRCALRATAPISRSPRKPRRRIRNWPAPSIPRPRRSSAPAARRCRSSSTSKTKRWSRTRIDKTAARFGGIDIVVNNASAIQLTNVAEHRHAALRPHAPDQCARHLRGLEMGAPPSGKGRQSPYPDAVAAARHERKMVRAAHRLFAWPNSA